MRYINLLLYYYYYYYYYYVKREEELSKGNVWREYVRIHTIR